MMTSSYEGVFFFGPKSKRKVYLLIISGYYIIEQCYVMEVASLNKLIKILIHASTWFAPVLLPLIAWLIVKDRDVKRLSLQAIVFHAIFLPLFFISKVLSILIIGIPFAIIFGIVLIYFPVKGIAYAWWEKPYEYPVAKWFIH
jgi:uncharacterized protein